MMAFLEEIFSILMLFDQGTRTSGDRWHLFSQLFGFFFSFFRHVASKFCSNIYWSTFERPFCHKRSPGGRPFSQTKGCPTTTGRVCSSWHSAPWTPCKSKNIDINQLYRNFDVLHFDTFLVGTCVKIISIKCN
jgi:hypothetical protein